MSTLILAVKQEYFQDEALDIIDRLILSYVSTWEDKNRTCFAKDQFFAMLFNVKEDFIILSLIKLETLGYITQVRGTGGRLIKTCELIRKELQDTDFDVFDNLY